MEFPGIKLDLSAMGKENRPDPSQTYDLLVLGGGPAALSAAIYAARKTLKMALLALDLGGQISETSEIENYPGFQAITGQELVEKFKQHVKKFDVPILEGEKVKEVRKEGEFFKAETEGGRVFSGRTVIVATGKRHKPLNVPGEKELVGKGVAYCATCDAPFFKDKRVVVAGGANSAFTAALDLLKVAREVTLVNFIPGWQADEVVRQSVEKHDNVRLLDEHAVVRINGSDTVTSVEVKDRKTGEQKTIPADGIFIEIGLLPNSEPIRNLAELNEWGELIVDCHCRSNVEGLFGAGDVTTVPHKQVIIAAGEGAKAALSAYEHLAKLGVM